jgi:hypothetical protein
MTPLTTLKIAQFAPIPRASVATVKGAKPGLAASFRSA